MYFDFWWELDKQMLIFLSSISRMTAASVICVWKFYLISWFEMVQNSPRVRLIAEGEQFPVPFLYLGFNLEWISMFSWTREGCSWGGSAYQFDGETQLQGFSSKIHYFQATCINISTSLANFPICAGLHASPLWNKAMSFAHRCFISIKTLLH